MDAELIDLVRIQSVIEAERRAHPASGLMQSVARSAVRFAVLFTLIVFLVPALSHWELTRLTGLSSAAILGRVSTILVVAVVISIFDVRARRRAIAQDPAVAAQRVAAEWRSLTLPDWWKRVLRQGAAITAGVSIPVGLVLAIRSPTTELPSGGRLALFIQFLVLTAAWALPAALWIRWLALRSYRRMSKVRAPQIP